MKIKIMFILVHDGLYALSKAHIIILILICTPPHLSEVSPTLPLKQFTMALSQPSKDR